MASNQSGHSSLVKSLTGLVKAAKEVVAASPGKDEGESFTIEQRLRRLYPSTVGNRNAIGKGTSSSSTQSPLPPLPGKSGSTDVRRPKFSFLSQSRAQSTSKGKLPIKKKVLLETLKDVFLLPRPDMDRVPRRKARDYFYRNNLVASAVKFNNTMSETDIKLEILCRFQQFECLDFTILRAVDESLIDPHIEDWDYATLKHITGQNPLYIRSNVDLEIDDLERETVDVVLSSDDDFQPCSSKSKVKRKLPHHSTTVNSDNNSSSGTLSNKSSHSSKTDTVDLNPPAISRTEESGPSKSKKICCPICYKAFSSKQIESHASQCAQKFDDFLVTQISDDDELDETLGYNEDPSTNKASITEDPATTLEEVLKTVVATQQAEDSTKMKIRRKYAWNDFCCYMKKPWVKPTNNVIAEFVGESCVDTGGPRREFFTVCLQQMAECLFVDGFPVQSTILISDRAFYYAGNLMTMSILQGGRNPAIFSQQCYHYICSKIAPSPSDYSLPEHFTKRENIRKLLDAEDDTTFQLLLLENIDSLCTIGYRGVPSKEKLAMRDQIVSAIYYKEYIEPIIPALLQLCDGLNIKNFLTTIQDNPLAFDKCFIKSNSKVLTIDDFYSTICVEFFETGTQKREEEHNIYKYFCDFLEQCFYDDSHPFSLNDILFWLSGSDTIPPLGFDKKIDVKFLHGCLPVRNKACQCLPVVSTCSLHVTFPVHVANYNEFNTMMAESIRGSNGFGRV